jgi:hypothetical protein
MSHTLQYLLVVADSAEEAREEVISKLEKSPQWSDWHNASGSANASFAGRWANGAFKFEEEEPDPVGVEFDTLCYSDNPALAEKIVERAIEWRQKEISYYKEKILTSAYDIVDAIHDPYEKERSSLNNYYYEKLANLLDNDWTPDSGIYDAEYWTASLTHWGDRVATYPDKQFIVAVDFHY